MLSRQSFIEEGNRRVNDRQLLGLFIERRDEAAFAALSRRYVNLVYSTCLRETRNVTLAEDATQAVFLLLARKAESLRGHAVLSGWLFHTARLVGKNALRNERCRKEYERKAVEEHMRAEPLRDAAWLEINDRLHESLARLASRDRDAILLRFFEDLSLAEVGERLGISEDAARVRVQRALERMRRRLPIHGTTLSVAALAAQLADNSVKPASAACRHAVEQIATHSAGSALASTPSYQMAQGVLKKMLISKLQIAAAIGVAVVSAGVVIKTTAGPRLAAHPVPAATLRVAQGNGTGSAAPVQSGAAPNAPTRQILCQFVIAEARISDVYSILAPSHPLPADSYAFMDTGTFAHSLAVLRLGELMQRGTVLTKPSNLIHDGDEGMILLEGASLKDFPQVDKLTLEIGPTIKADGTIALTTNIRTYLNGESKPTVEVWTSTYRNGDSRILYGLMRSGSGSDAKVLVIFVTPTVQ